MFEALVEGGLKPTEAKVLLFLFKKKTGQSREIEREMDLRQPEVSSAMSTFNKKKWIKIKQEKTNTKGRPVNIYTLTNSKKQILQDIKNHIQKEIDEKNKILKKLEEI